MADEWNDLEAKAPMGTWVEQPKSTVLDLLGQLQAERERANRLVAAILDIDAHATPFGEDEDGFVTGGYLISVGCLHRALGVVGHTGMKCPACLPESHDCKNERG